MPSDTAETATATAAVKYVPPPKPAEPVADVAALLNAGGKMMYRNETVLMNFRKNRETGERRPSFWVTVPVPTFDEVVAKISQEDPVQRGKYQNYILDLITEQVVNATRAQVGDEDNPVDSQEKLKTDQLTWEFLVNQPPSVRRGNGISKETWEAFGQDYLETMPGLTGKTKERIGNQVKLLVAKFAPCRTQKKVIKKLLEELEVYVGGAPSAEEYIDVIEAWI